MISKMSLHKLVKINQWKLKNKEYYKILKVYYQLKTMYYLS